MSAYVAYMQRFQALKVAIAHKIRKQARGYRRWQIVQVEMCEFGHCCGRPERRVYGEEI